MCKWKLISQFGNIGITNVLLQSVMLSGFDNFLLLNNSKYGDYINTDVLSDIDLDF